MHLKGLEDADVSLTGKGHRSRCAFGGLYRGHMLNRL